MHSPWDRRIGFPDPSLEPLRAIPFPSGPPRAPPKLTLEPPGCPRTPPRAPKGSQGPLKSAKLTIKKRWKYVYLALQDHEKLIFFIFWRFPGAPGTRLGQRPDHPDPPHGAQKRSRALPETSLGGPWAPSGAPERFFKICIEKGASQTPPMPPQGPLFADFSTN